MDSREELAVKIDMYHATAGTAQIKTTTWSMFDVSDFTQCPFPDMKEILYKCHWGDEPITVVVPTNPTWMQIWQAADQAVRLSGDHHHIFIEEFEPRGDGTYELYCGS